MNSRQLGRRGAVLALVSAGLGAPVHGAETIEQAVREADFIVDLRARYESVDQAGMAATADALTTRLRAGL